MPTGYPWASRGLPVGHPWASRYSRDANIILWATQGLVDGLLAGYLGDARGLPMWSRCAWDALGCPWDAHRLQQLEVYRLTLEFDGLSMRYL